MIRSLLILLCALAISGVAACASEPKKPKRAAHVHKKKWRTTKPKKVQPKKKPKKVAAKHQPHEHGHGSHPHSADAHHHHPHPHPHLGGEDGHHHAY